PHASADDSALMTLRVGILGFGGAGQAHAFYWSCVAGCRVTKIFDRDPAAAARAAKGAAGAGRVCPLRSLSGRPHRRPRAPPPTRPQARCPGGARGGGLPWLVERPLPDARGALRAIAGAGAAAPAQAVAVVPQMRFVPLHRRIKTLAASGALGRLSYLEGYYV